MEIDDPTIKVDIRCNKCRQLLAPLILDVRIALNTIYVDPCSKCSDKDFDDGYTQGFKRAEKKFSK